MYKWKYIIKKRQLVFNLKSLSTNLLLIWKHWMKNELKHLNNDLYSLYWHLASDILFRYQQVSLFTLLLTWLLKKKNQLFVLVSLLFSSTFII